MWYIFRRKGSRLVRVRVFGHATQRILVTINRGCDLLEKCMMCYREEKLGICRWICRTKVWNFVGNYL